MQGWGRASVSYAFPLVLSTATLAVPPAAAKLTRGRLGGRGRGLNPSPRGRGRGKRGRG